MKRHGSEKTVSSGASGAASASLGMLRFLQKSPKQVVQLPSRKEPTNSKVVPRNKQRSSPVEVVIPQISKGAQKLKKVGGGKDVRTKGCLGM